jgi:WD40 repeat protein
MSRPSPYPGLRAFRRDETHLFFGREDQTDELLEKLGRSRFLAVVGPSGGGKSSLVQAGMLPALETGFMAGAGPRWRVADNLRPGSHPLRRLAASLAERALHPERGGQPDAAAFLYATLRRGPLGLVEVLRGTPLPSHTNLLVLVDQFEEIFRYQEKGDRDEADAFVALLLQSATQTEMPIYVVLTMRSDYLGHCARFPGLPEAMNESQYLTPRMTREQRHEAIVGPARVCGGDVEPELVNCMLNDMGDDPDQLPLMQHVLMRMWSQRKSSGARPPLPATRTSLGGTTGQVLTVPDYDAAGGLAQALSLHADEALGDLNAEQQRIAAMLFRCLSEPGRDTRRPTTIAQIADAALHGNGDDRVARVKQVADVFRSPDRSFLAPLAPEPLFPETVLDISHECLIRQWNSLKCWVEQEAKSAEQYADLERAARRWKAGRAGLWGTPELDIALAWMKDEQPTEGWANQYGGNFSLVQDFLKQSATERRAAEEEEEARRRNEAQQKALTRYANRLTALSTVLVLALIATVWFATNAWNQKGRLAQTRDSLQVSNKALKGTKDTLQQKQDSLLQTNKALHDTTQEARTQRLIAQARAFAAAAIDNVSRDRQRSLLLALYSVSLNRNVVEVEDALRHAISADAMTLRGHTGRIRQVAVSNDGRFVATASDDSTAKVWDVNTGREVKTLSGHRGAVRGVAFGPDTSELATAADDGSARLWKGDSTAHIFCGCALGHHLWVGGVIYSPDYQRLVTINDDSTITLWDAQTGDSLFKLSDGRAGSDGRRGWRHAGWVHAVAFGPNSDVLATAGADGIAAIWDLSTRQVRARLAAGTDVITDIAFSPDGQRLVTSSEAGEIVVWSVPTRQRVLTFDVGAEVTAIALRPDGGQLATASRDRTVRLWDVTTGAEQFTLPGHIGVVTDVVFTRDGKRLVTGSADGTAKVWDVSLADQSGVQTIVENAAVMDAAFCPKEDCVATAADSNVDIWNGSTGTKLTTLEGHRGLVWAIAFSPDGNLLATTNTGSTAQIWNWRPGSKGEPLTLRGHRGWVFDLAFSADGRHVATASWDSTARIWDANSGVLVDSIPEQNAVLAVAYSRDGKYLALATGKIAQILDAHTYRRVSTLEGHTGFILAVDFSADGKRVATVASDSTVRIWNLRGVRKPSSIPLRGHEDVIWSVAFSPDGKRLATGGHDGTVRIWDVPRREELYAVRDQSSAIRTVTYSPDGRRLASGGADDLLHIDLLQVQDLVQSARRRVLRSLTDAECKRYLRDVCPSTVESLIANGRQAAEIGDFDKALRSFREAKARDPNVDLAELEGEARTLMGQYRINRSKMLVSRADSFSRAGRFDSLTVAKIDVILGELAAADSIFEVPAGSWNSICWFGTLWGHAARVIHACDLGVARSHGASYARDSRGVARAITGDTAGALADFVVFIDDKEQEEYQRLQRTEWVGSLRAGTNPFTRETLRGLLSQ